MVLFGLKFHKDDDYLIYIRSKCVSVLKGNGPIQGCQDIYMYYRVFFLTGPPPKSSKYGTGPPQQEKND